MDRSVFKGRAGILVTPDPWTPTVSATCPGWVPGLAWPGLVQSGSCLVKVKWASRLQQKLSGYENIQRHQKLGPFKKEIDFNFKVA